MSATEDLNDLDKWRAFTPYLLRNGHGDYTPRCWAGVQWGNPKDQCLNPAEGDIGLCPLHANTLVK